MHLKKPAKGKSLTRYLAHDELKKTVRTSSNYSEFPMLTASYTTGMRLNEVRMLDIGNLDFSRKTMTVRCGRLSGDREVSVNLDREKVLKVYLEKYLDKTRMLPNVPLFEGNRGNRIRTSENT